MAATRMTLNGTERVDRRAWYLVLAAALLAIAVRLAFVLETSAMPTARHPIGDAAGYLSWAGRIAHGDWIGDEPFYQAPLYAYVLAVLVWSFGKSILAIRVAQAVWGGIGVWCLGYGTARLFGKRTGVLAAFLLALYGPAVFFDGIIQKASLSGLLVCVLIAGMGWLRAQTTYCRGLMLGLTLALLILTRENAIVWIPFVGAWLYGIDHTRAIRVRGATVAVMLVGLAIPLGAVAIRNRLVGGNWSPTTYQSGTNFYIGNRIGADGRYQPLLRGHETPEFEGHDAALLAERHEGRELSPREVSRYWWGRTWEEIRADPFRWIRLVGWKLLLVWNRYEVPDAESFYVYREFSWTLSVLGTVFHFGVLCPLAAIGLVSTRRHWRRLWIWYTLIASMALSVAFFYVLARYRYPLVPLLIPFAAAGCMHLADGGRARLARSSATLAMIGVVVAVLANWPVQDERRLDALAWMNVGVALAEEGRIPAATDYFRRAVEGYPTSAEASNNLAQALALQGRYAEAIAHYQAALAAAPDLMGVDYNLAVALEHAGRTGEALHHYQRALALDPSDEDARRAIARLQPAP